MTESVAAVLVLEDSTPKLHLLVGEDLTEKVLAMASDFQRVQVPAAKKASIRLEKAVTAAVRKLDSLMIKGDDCKDDSTFYSKLSTAKVEKLRKARAELKLYVGEYEKHCEGGEASSEVQRANAANMQARVQVVRFGLLAFIFATDIRTDGEAGKP